MSKTLLTGILSITVAMPASAGAAVLFASNGGLDSVACGTFASPCATIGQTIQNASDGDVILVEPGTYGDRTGDGDFDDPGEEGAEIGFGCECVIHIDRRLVVVSREGAATTVIDVGGAAVSGIAVGAAGAVLGVSDHGFTISGASARSRAAVRIDPETAGAVVWGNSIVNGSDGLLVDGRDHLILQNTITHNSLRGIASDGEEHLVAGNLLAQNGTGLQDRSNGSVVVRNTIVENGHGVSVAFSTGVQLVRNELRDNILPGVWVSVDVVDLAIHGNNIAGNDDTGNCGVLNEGGPSVDARFNYWGAATGPGADPADNAGTLSGCDAPGMVTLVSPSASSPF